MDATFFYLEYPRQLNLILAEQLYQEATDQRSYQQKNILRLLRESLKFGNSESGWILVNFSRVTQFEGSSVDSKLTYLSYLIATVVLEHTEALQEWLRLIKKADEMFLLLMQKLVHRYNLMGYDTRDWDTLINNRLANLSNGFGPPQTVEASCQQSMISD